MERRLDALPLGVQPPIPVPRTLRKIRLNGFCKLVRPEDDGRDCSAGSFLICGEEAGEGVGKEDYSH